MSLFRRTRPQPTHTLDHRVRFSLTGLEDRSMMAGGLTTALKSPLLATTPAKVAVIAALPVTKVTATTVALAPPAKTAAPVVATPVKVVPAVAATPIKVTPVAPVKVSPTADLGKLTNKAPLVDALTKSLPATAKAPLADLYAVPSLTDTPSATGNIQQTLWGSSQFGAYQTGVASALAAQGLPAGRYGPAVGPGGAVATAGGSGGGSVTAGGFSGGGNSANIGEAIAARTGQTGATVSPWLDAAWSDSTSASQSGATAYNALSFLYGVNLNASDPISGKSARSSQSAEDNVQKESAEIYAKGSATVGVGAAVLETIGIIASGSATAIAAGAGVGYGLGSAADYASQPGKTMQDQIQRDQVRNAINSIPVIGLAITSTADFASNVSNLISNTSNKKRPADGMGQTYGAADQAALVAKVQNTANGLKQPGSESGGVGAGDIDKLIKGTVVLATNKVNPTRDGAPQATGGGSFAGGNILTGDPPNENPAPSQHGPLNVKPLMTGIGKGPKGL